MQGIGFTVAHFQGWKKTRKHILLDMIQGTDWLQVEVGLPIQECAQQDHIYVEGGGGGKERSARSFFLSLLFGCFSSFSVGNLRATTRTLTLGYGWILSTISQSWKEMWRSDRNYVLDTKVYIHTYTNHFETVFITLLITIIYEKLVIFCADTKKIICE